MVMRGSDGAFMTAALQRYLRYVQRHWFSPALIFEIHFKERSVITLSFVSVERAFVQLH